jgi:hypothetical protein
MNESPRYLQVGVRCSYRLVAGRGEAGVFEKTYPDGQTVYVVARGASVKAPNAPPAGVLQDFTDRTEALAALPRWSMRSQISRRRKRRDVMDGQSEFLLGPFQTKQEYQLEVLRRQLGRVGA